MRRLTIVAFALIVGAYLYADVDELAVARAALRDGLWEIARTHASATGGEEARLITLESFARESKWSELLAASDEADASEGSRYYRALALVESKRTAEADALLSAGFTNSVYSALAPRLRTRIAFNAGDISRAAAIVRESDFSSADAEAKMLAAEVLSAGGDLAAAEKLRRSILDDKKSNESERAAAAIALGNVLSLRETFKSITDSQLKREVGFALGRALLGSVDTLDEGADLIRSEVKKSPDGEGASQAYVQLADAYLGSRRYREASDAYRFAIDTWPALNRSAEVQCSRGWAFHKLGKNEDALEAFGSAETLSTNLQTKAMAILKSGDVYADAGRGSEAMDKYRQVLENYPETDAGKRLKGLFKVRELESEGREMFKSYRFAEAAKTFDEVAAADTTRKSRMDYFNVLCLFGQGYDVEAETRARSILDDSSTEPSVRAEVTLWLAKLDYNNGKWSESQRLFSEFADHLPDHPKAPEALYWATRSAFAANDFNLAVQTATKLVERFKDSPIRAKGYLVQGEALIELARFDEAVLVLERAMLDEGVSEKDRMRAQLLRADALFAMGADDTRRYQDALKAYRALALGGHADESYRLRIAYKVGRTLEKLKLIEEAVDQYYTRVVLAYREGRRNGVKYDEEARAAFSRAAFRLADEYESRGKNFQAMHILDLVVASDVPAADEAEKRIDRIQTKGRFQ